MQSMKIQHGFYRHTDIWWEWNKVLPNPEDAGPLKAILAYDSLVHPDHPLRKEGKDGIELTMGILPNGEARLLFSSAQVEYIRYWLHAMSFTKELIPLPYSTCMLTRDGLQTHTPVIYKTALELRNANKRIEKNNKRLKGSDSSLHARRVMFERIRSLWAEKHGVWCAIDFEAWDRDHEVLTEIGWSLVRWVDGKESEEWGHLIVKEHRYYTNTYVASNREHYNFGESEIVNKKEFRKRIHDLFASIASLGPLFLVFHDNSQDVKYLRSRTIEAPIDSLSYLLPESCAASAKTGKPEMFVVDTVDLFSALEGGGGEQKRSLEQVCRHLRVQTEYLHNAGNDARYTHLALAAMASGDPLDLQREKRWPNHTAIGRGPRVHFSKLEENSDASDLTDDDEPIMEFQLANSSEPNAVNVKASANGQGDVGVDGSHANGTNGAHV
ncbi:hypothetical protein EW146_g1404 [Bondarzewia mesenterica]|uniref:Gfd2/YDR514C-like C-terminal domain-containing protein n=1 Tax=Bondarzewia mesenterica TaxID=1095465 RepID=A0A4S4M6A5_9AGAM|nr:hypothetical protein EW146_g1404 [Bondarzewia mesenterica]